MDLLGANDSDEDKPMTEKDIILAKYSHVPERKVVSSIHSHIREFDEWIGKLRSSTTEQLLQRKNRLWKRIDETMNKYRTSLQNEKRQKQEDIKDPQEQEKTLKENLETMT